ncbi:P-loop containing nucleoside triphosphate hydrolase protein [Tuber brumale]|nr:P-loop containing nucleoside triphosphate hydrolase protein [Tuber brumale]
MLGKLSPMQLERRVLAVVRRYIDEHSVTGENNGSLYLSVSRVYQYKGWNLEKMIEKVLATVRDKEAEAGSLDSDLGEVEELNEEDLMKPKESNTINQEVAGSTIPGSPAPRKRKERLPVNDGVSVKRQKQNNSREPPKDICLKDIGGGEDVIKYLLELMVMSLIHPEVYLHTGVDLPRANAIAREFELPFIAISAPSIRDMERRVVAQMPTCTDDLTLEKTGGKPVMIIGATNRTDCLDPALRRAGRFDKQIYLDVPDEVGIEKILRVLCEKLRLTGDFDFKRLARATAGFVGADLSALAGEAGMSLSSIQRFLHAYPHRVTGKQLDPLHIMFPDFLTALTEIQPSSKREGFSTVPDVTWADVGALESLSVELQMAVVLPIKFPEVSGSVGLTAPSGVLLWDPPGCSKTLLAKAAANESGANFISIRGPELRSKYVGESERAVRQVFSRARASIPCVIFFDELDSLAPRRNSNPSESSSRNLYYCGNRPDMIDQSILRPGILDTLLFVDLPNAEGRVEIFKTITKNTPLSNVDLITIGKHNRCTNFSSTDLAALVKQVTTLALRQSVFTEIGEVKEGKNVSNLQVVVTEEHLENSSANIRPSVSEDSREQHQELTAKFVSEGQPEQNKLDLPFLCF